MEENGHLSAWFIVLSFQPGQSDYREFGAGGDVVVIDAGRPSAKLVWPKRPPIIRRVWLHLEGSASLNPAIDPRLAADCGSALPVTLAAGLAFFLWGAVCSCSKYRPRLV